MAHEVKLTMDGLLLNWLKQVGDAVKTGEVLAEVEADKATVEVEATADGVLLEQRVETGAELSEGTVIAVIGAAGESAASAAAPVAAAVVSSAPAVPTQKASNGAALTPEGRVKASPLARVIAAQKGVDLGQVAGSGPGGRIVRADVEGFTPAAAPAAAPAAKPISVPSLGAAATYGALPQGDDVEIIDVSRMRHRIAENTILSKQQIPHFYVTTEIDVEPLLALRTRLNDSLKDEGIKISVNDMVVKAAALALKRFPNLNTHYYGDKLVRYKRINIGIAVALPNNGLMNIVAHDADKVALSALAVQNKERAERAREGKVKPEDIKGATFTVSNLGPYDVDVFSAIINPPEAAILAVSTAKKVPVVLPDGTLGVGSRMKITISVDHRVSDGAEGAEYLKHLKDLLENPMRLVV